MPIHGFPGNVISATPPSVTPAGASGVFTTEQQMQYQTAGNWPMAATQISRSLRFNSADSAYLNRTPASAGNRKTWTWSGWIKLSSITTDNFLFSAYSGSTADGLRFRHFSTGTYPDSLMFYLNDVADGSVYTNAVFRDVSAWYHIVLAVDTTQATASNRIKIYVNGTQQTFASAAYPSQNYDCRINNNVLHNIGAVNGGTFFSGYMTEINFIDGYALTPASFGQTNSNTGIWEPRQYTGPYGTNGFYLNFSDNSGTTSTTLGKDYSGNGNNWTPNNFSVTAGAGNDSLVDTPTPYGTDTGAGGEVRGNYCTLNPLTKGAYLTLSNGNLQTAGNSATDSTDARSTFAFSTGKWYWEFTPTTINPGIYPFNGIILSKDATSPNTGTTNQVGVATNSVGYLADGNKRVSNSTTSYGNSYVANDVIGVAVDADNGAIYFSKNGTWQNSGSPTSGSSKTGAAFTWTGGASEYVAAVSEYNTSASNINFGQRPFAYTAPSGFKALCTQNLPTPTIGATATTRADDYFNTVLYTGNGSTQSITGVGFQPDFVWLKSRRDVYGHQLFDAVRGATKRLSSNVTDAEVTNANSLTAFNSDGFSVGTDAGINTSTNTMVSWNWKANGAGSSNTQGSITSTVSANTTAGFSIVTYTGTGANATVGHGLGVAPQMIIIKNRTGSGVTSGWGVYHVGIGATKYLALEQTAAAGTSSALWNNTAPTSTVFSLGNEQWVNTNGGSQIAYCFAPVAGYSAFGSYTGNGSSTNGPFIYTGFRPALIMMKASGATGAWTIFDSKRNPSNGATFVLQPNSSAAEGTFTSSEAPDLLSNGFRLNFSYADYNSNGVAYIYAAFAEFPFKYTLAR